MGNVLPPPSKLSEAEERSVIDYDVTVQAIVDYILSGRAQEGGIVMMVGAGISVSAGIPDFRSPGTGLYNNLQKYKLPSPQSMFEIEYFRRNPQPFCELAREMYPGNFRPTPTHWFIRLLQEKGLLTRCYTQNIDTLEREAGIDEELLVEAHGSFGTARCIECGTSYSQDWVRDQIFADKIPRCTRTGCIAPPLDDESGSSEAGSPYSSPVPGHSPKYSPERLQTSSRQAVSGLVKPDIVFFGESLPKRFFHLKGVDLPRASLLIVAGTSLAVQPFAGVKDEANPLIPRLLINREAVGQRDCPNGHGFRFDCYDNYRDVAFLSDCDRAVTVLCHLLGWTQEFKALVREHGKGIELPPLISPAEDEESGEEKLRQEINRTWRATPAPLPDLQEILEERMLPEGATPMDICEKDTKCELIFPKLLNEVRGKMKIQVKITLEHNLMAHTTDRDWLGLMAAGSRFPSENIDFAWVDFDDDDEDEEEKESSNVQHGSTSNGVADPNKTDGSLNQINTKPRCNYCTVNFCIPSCSQQGGEGTREPDDYEIWYVGNSDMVMARWGFVVVSEDLEQEEPDQRNALQKMQDLLKSVQGTLDDSAETQERLQKILAGMM